MQGRRERPYPTGMGATEDAAGRRLTRLGSIATYSEPASNPLTLR